MLDSYKKLHEKCADIIPGWRTMNKNDLVNKYLEVEDDPRLADAYMSAIIVRYWGAISKYHALSYGSVKDPTTYYDWLVLAILWAVKHRKWKDPTNKLYNDPNGPDKVINRVIISERLIWFQSSNTSRRRQNFNLLSIEGIQEDYGEECLASYEDMHMDESYLDITNTIDGAFKNGEYVLAFMVDNMVNYDVFDKPKNKKDVPQFNKRKLLRRLHNLGDEDYIKTFSELYEKPVEDVRRASQECLKLSGFELRTAVDRNMKKLQRIYSR